jgi:mRNA interferase HigB
MRIHLIRKETIEDYVTKNARSRPSFFSWLAILKFADWYNPQDIKLTYGSADILGFGYNRVVFNIGGNRYRMICKYHFGQVQVHLFVCWIGTHDEYNYLCQENKQFTVTDY